MQPKTQTANSGARNCYPAPHCCKQLISNSIDIELIANSIELIANSTQTRGARLSLALLPEEASSLWPDKRRSKGTLKVQNLSTFTSASAKQSQQHSLCIDHRRFVTPELKTSPRQNMGASLAPWMQLPEILQPSHPTTWNTTKQKAQCGGFPHVEAVLKLPEKGKHSPCELASTSQTLETFPSTPDFHNLIQSSWCVQERVPRRDTDTVLPQ